jgi:hypothetical protein
VYAKAGGSGLASRKPQQACGGSCSDE